MPQKLTKQGIRDLGGNRHRPTSIPKKLREYRVDVGPEYGERGMVLRVEAQSIQAAIQQARRILDTYTAMGWEIIQVYAGHDIVWDYFNGFLPGATP